MRRIFALVVIILLILGSTTGYLFLNEKITAGSTRITQGEQQIAQGKEQLARGKIKLAEGKSKLSQYKNKYESAKMASYMLGVVTLPAGGEFIVAAGDQAAKQKLAEGDELVAAGSQKIQRGEAQLAAGQKALDRGKAQLALANYARIAFGVAAVFFTVLLIVLVIYWILSRRPREG